MQGPSSLATQEGTAGGSCCLDVQCGCCVSWQWTLGGQRRKVPPARLCCPWLQPAERSSTSVGQPAWGWHVGPRLARPRPTAPLVPSSPHPGLPPAFGPTAPLCPRPAWPSEVREASTGTRGLRGQCALTTGCRPSRCPTPCKSCHLAPCLMPDQGFSIVPSVASPSGSWDLQSAHLGFPQHPVSGRQEAWPRTPAQPLWMARPACTWRHRGTRTTSHMVGAPGSGTAHEVHSWQRPGQRCPHLALCSLGQLGPPIHRFWSHTFRRGRATPPCFGA